MGQKSETKNASIMLFNVDLLHLGLADVKTATRDRAGGCKYSSETLVIREVSIDETTS